MNLEKRLQRWRAVDLVTDDQIKRILDFEREQPSASWILYGITGLGVTVILTGVISIIAANWAEISPLAKLVLYFVSLAAIIFCAWRRSETPGVVREALLAGLGVYVLAGIGLIGQTYHLVSGGYQGVFLWLAIILPTTLLTSSRLLNHVWFMGLITGVSIWLASTSTEANLHLRVFATVALPYFFLAIGYSLGHRLEHFGNAARLWSFAVILVPLAVCGNLAWSAGNRALFTDEFSPRLWVTLPLAGAFAACVAANFRRFHPSHFLTGAIIALIASSCVLILPTMCLELPPQSDVVGCFLFLLPWASAAAVAAAMERKRLFDLAALVIGIRFIVVYFQVFGSLAVTGVGLIISGSVILGIAYLWYRYRGNVARAIREAV